MTEVPPILTDKAAEQAFLVNLNARQAAVYLERAQEASVRSIGRQGLRAFLTRLEARLWLRDHARYVAKTEAARLGL